MAGLSLVVPMAGRGSRFARDGLTVPKPLIELDGRPFFWWAIESVTRAVDMRDLVVVVLQEHVEAFAIDEEVRRLYPRAHIVALPEVTAGAAETAALGIAALTGDGPFAVNDCDHAFRMEGLPSLVEKLGRDVDGALVGFRSASPSYSFVRLQDGQAGPDLRVAGTVEKQVVSPFAIAGCYFFSSPSLFSAAFEEFRNTCPYDELFLSGIYNVLCTGGRTVLFQELQSHVSFGTPEELARVDLPRLQALHQPPVP